MNSKIICAKRYLNNNNIYKKNVILLGFLFVYMFIKNIYA